MCTTVGTGSPELPKLLLAFNVLQLEVTRRPRFKASWSLEAHGCLRYEQRCEWSLHNAFGLLWRGKGQEGAPRLRSHHQRLCRPAGVSAATTVYVSAFHACQHPHFFRNACRACRRRRFARLVTRHGQGQQQENNNNNNDDNDDDEWGHTKACAYAAWANQCCQCALTME